MVEKLCGPDIRTNFDDVECEAQDLFSSDDGCSRGWL